MRLEAMPDLPTVRDFVPGYEASQWYAIGLRRSTSTEIIDILNKEINTALAEPKLTTRRRSGHYGFPRHVGRVWKFRG